MIFAGYFGIFIGILMAAQWAFFIAVGQVPELASEPIRALLVLALVSVFKVSRQTMEGVQNAQS